jgi:hypothetical protein
MIYEITLDYNTDIFLSADYNVHSGSCISHQVHELKDLHETYGGFPDSYDIGNTMIRQLWWDKSQVDFEDLGNQLQMEVVTVSTILQPPGNIIPIHRDTFFQIKKRFPNDTRRKVRANIYLEDWKVGHFLQYQINNDWHNSTHWKANQGFVWDSNHLHLSANAGMNNKYTLQVSGFINENTT